MNIIFFAISSFTDIEAKGGSPDLMGKFKNEGHNIFVVAPYKRRYNKQTTLEKQRDIHLFGVKSLNIQKTIVIEK